MTKFLKGADNWYFLNNDSNKVVDEITGRNVSSKSYALQWRSLFLSRLDVADELGVKLVTFIVPNKHCIYPQYLPSDIKVSNQRLALIGGFDQLKSVIYDPKLFLNEDAFHKNDTHWTDYGAYIAFVRIMAEFNLKPEINFCQDGFNREFCQGDLTGSEGSKKELVLKDQFRIEEIYDNGILHVGRVRVYKNKKIKKSGLGRKIAIFGGSSANQIIDFFAHEFEEVVHVWTQSIDWQVVKEHSCAFVLTLPRERFMVQVATDDLDWEYQQGNALKYLGGTAYSISRVKGVSNYFGHIGYKNSIDTLAISILALHTAKKPTADAISRVVNVLDRQQIEGLIKRLVSIGISKELLVSLTDHRLSNFKIVQDLKLSLRKLFDPSVLIQLLDMKLSKLELLEVFKIVNKRICSGDLIQLNNSNSDNGFSSYCYLIEMLESSEQYDASGVRGFVDGIFGVAIKGWCFTDATIKHGVELIINNTISLNTDSTIYRRDLENNGIGNGKHGFSFNIDLDLIVGLMEDLKDTKAVIIDKGSNGIIPRGMMYLKAPYASLYLDSYDVNTISGWVVDYSYPERTVPLNIFIGDVLVLKVIPTILRSDLEIDGFSKVLGFNVSLAGLLSSGSNLVIIKDAETGIKVSDVIEIIFE